MRNATRAEVIVTVLFTVLAGAIGFYFAGRPVWHDLGPPPETLQRIQAVSTHVLFAQGESGKVYTYYDKTLSVVHGYSPAGQWTTEPPQVGPVAYWRPGDCARESGVGEAYPARVIKDSWGCRLDFEAQATYAIFEDGHVWRRVEPNEFSRLFAIPCLSGLSALSGLGLGIGLLGLLKKLTRPQAMAV